MQQLLALIAYLHQSSLQLEDLVSQDAIDPVLEIWGRALQRYVRRKIIFLRYCFLGKLELTMTAETARKISSNPEVLKRLAKYLALQCFRNTMLEDLHAGITPDSQTGDYTDVFVQSPYGQIPWPRLSRLSDEEMKALMIDVVNKTYRALRVLFDDRLGSEVIKILTQQDLVPRWNEPTTD